MCSRRMIDGVCGRTQVLQQMGEAGTRQVVEDVSVEHTITGIDSKGPGTARSCRCTHLMASLVCCTLRSGGCAARRFSSMSSGALLQPLLLVAFRQILLPPVSIPHCEQRQHCLLAGVYVVMVIRASSKNPVTGKRIQDDRVCNIHHMVDGKLARMKDFRGESACAILPAFYYICGLLTSFD